MKLAFIFTTFSLMVGLSSSPVHAENQETWDEAEQAQFAELAAASDPSVIQPAQNGSAPNKNDTKTFLGRITKSSTRESIEIYCTNKKCQSYAFYYALGGNVEESAFAIYTTEEINDAFEKKKPKHHTDFRGLKAVGTARGKGDCGTCKIVFGSLCGITEAVAIYDIAAVPVHALIYHGKIGTLKKARQNVYRALTSGSTVMVSDRQYKKITDLLDSDSDSDD